jgi:cobalt/nickel transport system permease protein
LILLSKTSRKLYFFLLAEIFLFAALNLAIFSFFLGKEILLEIFGFYIYRDGLKLGILLFFRMLAGFSCLYFLISTTPSTQLFSALTKIGIPEVFIEVMAFIYRYIFLAFRDAGKMIIALRSRTGSIGFQGFKKLLPNLFIRSLKMQEMMWISMTARCYSGKYPILKIESAKITELIPIILFDFVLIILALNTQYVV